MKQSSRNSAPRRARTIARVKLPVRRAILDRKTYEAPAEGRLNKVRLDFNENTTGCGPAVLRALKKLAAKQIAMYPEYTAPTIRIAKHFGVAADELLLTNGGDDAIRVFFDTFVDPGSHILICEPTFPMYRYYAEIAGARIETLRYGPQMEFPLDEFISALSASPRVVFIANPNNPTGTLLSPAQIERILHAAPNTAVVLDEAYADFSGVTVLPLIRKYPHLFITRTFSKAAGIASLRLGAVIASRESLAIVRRAMPPFPVNLAALVAAEAAVTDRRAIEKYVRATRDTREWFIAQLESMGVTTFPSSAKFVLVNFGAAGPQLFKKLASRQILVRERSKDMGSGFARITIGKRTEMLQLLKIANQVLSANKRRRSTK
jgi:histidinol-phosphate aminotransferase